MYAARSPHLSLSEMFRKNCLSLIASTVIFPEEHMLCQGISYDTSHGKGKSPGVPFHGVISKHRQFKKFEFVRPFRKATQKTQSCFALDTEKGYWPVTVQPLYRVKKIVIASNVLPLSPSQTSSSQNSKFYSHLIHCKVDSLKPN